jgi:hypothetical protein
MPPKAFCPSLLLPWVRGWPLGSHYVPIFLSSLCRLIISPIIALLIILGLGLEGLTAQALLMASAFPTSRNSALLALEYKNQPEFAAQAVLVSTQKSDKYVHAAAHTHHQPKQPIHPYN